MTFLQYVFIITAILLLSWRVHEVDQTLGRIAIALEQIK